MKIRNGFVSNSSSVSFVAIGYKIDEQTARKYLSDVMHLDVSENDDVQETIETLDGPIESIGDLGFVLGKVFKFSSDGGGDDKMIKNAADVIAEIEKQGNAIGLGKPKIFTGEYMG